MVDICKNNTVTMWCYMVAVRIDATAVLHLPLSLPYNRLMALSPGLPGWAGTRRNIHPHTHEKEEGFAQTPKSIAWELILSAS